MQAVMIEITFYGVPHTKGYFEEDHTVDPDEFQKELDEEKPHEHDEPKTNDDEFKAIN